MGSCENDVTELPGREELRLPLLELVQLDVEPRADSDALVEPAKKVDDDLSAPVVINDLKFANIATMHHHLEELDDDFAARPDEDLALTPALGVCDGLEGVCQN